MDNPKFTLACSIGNQVGDPKYNLHNCNVFFEGLSLQERASAQCYENFHDAWSYYNILLHSGSENLPTPLGIVEGAVGAEGAKRVGWVVIVEELVTFDDWLKKESKQMWKARRGETYGVGYDFKLIFSQIMAGLQAIHKGGFRHLNLAKGGVAFGKDGRIKLHNFGKSTGDHDEYLLMDFKHVRALMCEAIAKHPSPYNDVPPEVWQFFELLDAKSRIGNEYTLSIHAKWVYHAPIFWGPVKKRVFYDTLYDMMHVVRDHDPSSQLELKELKFWQKQISITSPLNDTLYYDPKNPTQKAANPINQWYSEDTGLPILVRNFYHDPQTCVIIQEEEVESDFPRVLGYCYICLATTKFLEIEIVIDSKTWRASDEFWGKMEQVPNMNIQ